MRATQRSRYGAREPAEPINLYAQATGDEVVASWNPDCGFSEGSTHGGRPNSRSTVVGQYTVFLVRDTLAGSSQSPLTIAPAVLGGGQTSIIVHHVITPTATEIVASGESFQLQIGSFTNNDNGFCQATVTYDTNG